MEELHQQSIEWLNEIVFWRDETAFFYTLIVSDTLHNVPEKYEIKRIKIEDELIKISSGELDTLEKEVELHERYLDILIKGRRADEEIYRDIHKDLMFKFYDFEAKLKSLKKEIFSLVESGKHQIS